MSINTPGCRLCFSVTEALEGGMGASYYYCPNCQLISLDPARYLKAEEEKQRYLTHNNDPQDEGYRKFLSRLADPLLEKLSKKEIGLDYGCGPGPTLSVLFEERGHGMHVYDPFFYPDTTALENSYDFVTCSETAEHFYHPRKEWDRLYQLVKPGGWLGIMTQMWSDLETFFDWYYIRDPTHVSLYHRHTFRWLAGEYGYDVEIGNNVVLFKKNLES